MSNHGLRRIFSLLLAVMMVCTLLPTAVFAQEATEQPVVEEKQDVLPAEGEKKEEEAVTPDGENDVQPEANLNSDANQAVVFASGSSGITVSASCIGAMFISGSTGEHTVKEITRTVYVTQDDIGSRNANGSAKARFTGSNEAGWTLVIDLEIGNYKGSILTNARITNKDMSKATGSITFGVTAGKNVSTHITIMGASSLPDPAPSTPTEDQVVRLKPQVRVDCLTANGTHQPYQFDLGYGTFTVGKVTGDATNGYKCTVTMTDADSYVTQFNNLSYVGGVKHTLSASESVGKTFTLLYKNGSWTVSSNPAVIYEVRCETAPTKPSISDIDATLDVFLKCSVVANHNYYVGAIKQQDVTDKRCEISEPVKDSSGVYTCTLTVYGQKFVDEYNSYASTSHTLDDAESKVITLTYNTGTKKWDASPKSVTFSMTCKPGKPSAPTGDAVLVKCTTNDAHTQQKYALINGTYNIGDVVSDGKGGYTCDITITNTTPYVAKFNETYTGHTDSVEGNVLTIKMTYMGDNKWVYDSAALINVKCETAPATPGPGVLNNLNMYVKFNCTEDDTHNNSCLVTRSGVTGGYEVTAPVKQSDGKYTSTLTVNPQPYFDHLYGSTTPAHTLETKDAQTVTLTYDPATEKWTASSRTVEFNIKCEPVVEPPEKPSEDQIKDLLEGAVVIRCINEDANHGDISFTLAEGEYVLGEAVEENAGVYTYTVTVKPAKYVKAYSELPDINKEHKLSPDTQGDKTIKLQYVDKEWQVVEGAAPVTYTVICENEPQKPDAPTNDEIKKATAAVKCTTGHGDLSWTLRDGTFTVGEVTGDDTTGYTCTVTVKAEVYVNAFNSNKKADGVKHTLADDAEKTFTMTYVNGAWTRPTNPAVTFEVKCETEPEITYTVTYTDGVDGEVVFADQVFKDLKSGEATPKFNGTPTRKNYIFAGWNPTVADKVTANATYTATWKEDFNNNGKPDDEEDRYTVTYKDGASGKAFADQVYKDLLPGVDTPEFSGKPTRKGYTFAGWSPKVADTVTKTVTYTATWKATSTTGKDKVPKTGDSGMVLILGSVMLFSLCGAAAVYVFDRKRKQG